MLRFIVRRLLVTIPTILVVISLTWVLIKLAPGNFYSGEKQLPAAIEKTPIRLDGRVDVFRVVPRDVLRLSGVIDILDADIERDPHADDGIHG